MNFIEKHSGDIKTARIFEQFLDKEGQNKNNQLLFRGEYLLNIVFVGVKNITSKSIINPHFYYLPLPPQELVNKILEDTSTIREPLQ